MGVLRWVKWAVITLREGPKKPRRDFMDHLLFEYLDTYEVPKDWDKEDSGLYPEDRLNTLTQHEMSRLDRECSPGNPK